MDFEMRFQVLFRSNIKSHRRWFEWLSSGAFFQTAAERYESATNVAAMHELAQQVIETEIYNKHDGEGRTYSLLDSFLAAPTGKGITVYSDPAVAPSKGPFGSGSPEAFSYAAFFEETAFNSFILGAGNDVFNEIKHRPFYEPLERAVEELARETSMRAILSAVVRRMPKAREI